MSNKKLLIITAVNIVLLFTIMLFYKAEAMVEEVPATCPAGSYEIGRKEPDGEPICKLEPTGCPYGDSIPMDMCDKFAPQPEEPVVVPEPVTPQPVKECGK